MDLASVLVIIIDCSNSFTLQVIKKRPAFITVFRIWILPQYESDVWWELGHEDLAQLPSDQNCSNQDIIDFTTKASVVTVSFLNYNKPDIQPKRNMGDLLYNLVINSFNIHV